MNNYKQNLWRRTIKKRIVNEHEGVNIFYDEDSEMMKENKTFLPKHVGENSSLNCLERNKGRNKNYTSPSNSPK